MSEDPIGFSAGDVNLHRYVGSAPTLWRDPTGLVVFPPGSPCGPPTHPKKSGIWNRAWRALFCFQMPVPIPLIPGRPPIIPHIPHLPDPPSTKGSPKPSPNFEPPTNPPQMPPDKIPTDWRVREMPPTEQYPDGYWKLEKPMRDGSWQPIDPSTMKPGDRRHTHVPFPPGGGH